METNNENLSMADFEDQLDKGAFDGPKWTNFSSLMKEKKNISAKIDGITKGGFAIILDDIRGFLPFSKASFGRIDNPEKMLGNDIDVRIIEVDRDSNRLIFSALEIIREKEREDRKKRIDSINVGDIFEGKVDSIQDFGVFVKNDEGVTGLVHVSQISYEKVKHPKDVFKLGDKVKAEVVKNNDGKIGLSIKALLDDPHKEEKELEKSFDIPTAEKISTNLGDLLNKFNLPE